VAWQWQTIWVETSRLEGMRLPRAHTACLRALLPHLLHASCARAAPLLIPRAALACAPCLWALCFCLPCTLRRAVPRRGEHPSPLYRGSLLLLSSFTGKAWLSLRAWRIAGSGLENSIWLARSLVAYCRRLAKWRQRGHKPHCRLVRDCMVPHSRHGWKPVDSVTQEWLVTSASADSHLPAA